MSNNYAHCFNRIDFFCYLSYRVSLVWSCIIFSIILETIGRSKIDLKFLGSVLVPFLYCGLSFATLHSFGTSLLLYIFSDIFMNVLQICVIEMINILALYIIYQICFLFWQLCLRRSFLEDLRYIWFELFEELIFLDLV